MSFPPLEKRLLQQSLRLVRVDHHLSFLQTCIERKTVPKGLSLKLHHHGLGSSGSRFLRRWNSILNEASLSLMRLSCSKYQQQHVSLELEINRLNNSITESDVNNETLARITQIVESKSRTLRTTRHRKLSSLGITNASTATPLTNPITNKKCRSRRFRKKTTSCPTSQDTSNTIINLSSTVLTQAQESLLSKGLNFCPAPTAYDRGNLIQDNKLFSRRLRLRSHFTKETQTHYNSSTLDTTTSTQNTQDTMSLSQNSTTLSQHTIQPTAPSQNTQTPTASTSPIPQPKDRYQRFQEKSDWQPPKQCRDLETAIRAIESDIASHKPNSHHNPNLTKQERGALRSLQSNDDIVIKPADKGSAVVIMDRDHYISEAERQLHNPTYYTALDHDPTQQFATKVEEVVNKMHEAGYISEKNREYLTVSDPKAGRFYLLPKVHKSGVPGRPIVSANGHPTERISEFLDFHLRHHVRSLPSHLKDTTDYLRKVESLDSLPDETLLVSLDVTSLYTNIPHNEGIEACREVWDSRLLKDPPTEYLVDLLTLVLECNNFVFNGQHYLQVCGTAMGTRVAPSYANIFMGRLESQLLRQSPLQPLSWFRFIDDIDMKWCHGRDSLDRFLELANAFHPTIKFTTEISNEKHVFLDTVSKLVENKIDVDLYTKPTDTHQYLLPSSCHPKHICKNIPYSMALRIRRICSDTATFEARARELACQLRGRGYKQNDIDAAIEKVKDLDRTSLLSYTTKEDTTAQRVPFVVTFHPDLPPIRNIIDKHWPTIESSERLAKMFPQKPVVAYRRPKSLRDLLVRAKLKPSTRDQPYGLSKACNKPRCQTCKMMPTAAQVVQHTSGARVSIRCNATCKSSNLVYVISCSKCGKQYIGETKQALNLRVNLHRSDYNKRRFERSPVAEHFHGENHSFDDAILHCIDHDPSWSDSKRKQRETYWIRRFNAVQPLGINRNDGGAT